MLTFAAAVFFLLITPGPGVLTTAGVGSGFGYAAGLRFLAGLFIGTNLVAAAVVTGLAAIVLSEPAIRIAATWASVAFFVYLAARIALSGAKIGFMEAASAPGFVNGVLLQFINPKAVEDELPIAFPPDALGETKARAVIFRIDARTQLKSWIAERFDEAHGVRIVDRFGSCEVENCRTQIMQADERLTLGACRNFWAGND